jgi:hypothetical protein
VALEGGKLLLVEGVQRVRRGEVVQVLAHLGFR